MNEQLRTHTLGLTTRAAEGLPRRRWTTAELERMVAAGILDPDERFELIGGEVVPMSPKGRRHEIVRDELTVRWTKSAPAGIWVSAEPQLNLSDDVYTIPDLALRPTDILMPDVRGPSVLLVIEVAETSLQYDMTTKAALYAAHGVRDYWVIEARTLMTKVMRDPSATGYASITPHAGSELLVPQLAPALAIRLEDLAIQS